MKKQRLKKNAYYDEDRDLMMDLGPELYEYFDDVRLMKKPKQSKGKKKGKARFAVGDQVEITAAGLESEFGMIIYGPYDGVNNLQVYEIEKENGEIVTLADDGSTINKYVPPKPEQEDDEF